MERLTERDEDGNAFVAGCDYAVDIVRTSVIGYGSSDLQKALNKLADYEDAEENGTLIKLPCKVGDTVYAVMLNDNEEMEVCPLLIDRFLVYENNEVEIEAYIPSNSAVRDGFTFDTEKIGKTVFLNREEAESALKERERE